MTHPTAPKAPLPAELRAVLWMCGAMASFTLMAVAGRQVQSQLSSFELMFWRSALGLMIVVAIVSRRPAGFAQLRPSVPWLHLWRNVFHFAGQNLWFTGLMMLPLAQLVALEFTMPIWVVLLAPLLLRERTGPRRLAVALLGFAGVMLVVRPGVAPLGAGHVIALMAAVGFAVNVMLTRRIMGHDTVLCVLFWMTLSQSIFGLTLALPTGFSWPDVQLYPWLLVLGITGLSAHYSLTSALGLVPASQVAPMEFARLPLIAIVGMFLYDEALDIFVFLGAAIIIAANTWNLRTSRPADR